MPSAWDALRLPGGSPSEIGERITFRVASRTLSLLKKAYLPRTRLGGDCWDNGTY